jgi:hypothetical protein
MHAGHRRRHIGTPQETHWDYLGSVLSHLDARHYCRKAPHTNTKTSIMCYKQEPGKKSAP